MTTPHIVVRGGDYEHTLGIAGEYAGVRLGYETMRLTDIFHGMLERRAFEACEFSLANYIVLRARGEDWLSALPVFPNRAFRHSIVVTRRASSLASLAELAGRRVGVEDYSMTAAVWVRGLLEDDYGVDPASVTWVTNPKQRFPFPGGARVEVVDDDLETLVCEGRLDAMLAFALADARLPANERRLRPVLGDPDAAERAYYERTSIYPINHCVVIRADALEAHPGAARAIEQAFTEARDRACRRQLGATLVPWGKAHWARAFEVFGGDPLPYGLTPVNRRVVETLIRYLARQGFIEREPAVGELFLKTG